MTFVQRGSCWLKNAAQAAAAGPAPTALLLALAAIVPAARAQTLAADPGWQNVTLEQYRRHLEQLEGAVTDCAAQLKLKTLPPAGDNACDPSRVGPDDRVSGAVTGDSEPREVRYDWLRSLLARAGSRDNAPQPEPGQLISHSNTPPPPFDTLLSQALARLRADGKQAEGPAAGQASYAAERQALASILSQKAYKGVTEVSARERFLEWLDSVIDRFLSSLVRFGSRSRWIGWTLLGLLLLGIGVGIVWAFLRIERTLRVKIVPDDFAVPPGSPSARDWQLWYQDASAMAAKQQWREAIHFLYWASISLLESRRTWSADRTRTPREYLGLMPAGDPRKPALTELTHSFERTWYGGRDAAPSDFHSALDHVRSMGLGVKTE